MQKVDWPHLLEVEPNHAHKMLAELEKWHDVTIITQNATKGVDKLIDELNKL